MSTPPHFHLLTSGVLVTPGVTHSGGPRTIPSDEVYRIASLGIKKLGGPESRSSSLLVILHYLLKNNIEDFNTRCCKNQLSGPLGFLPMFVGGSRANGRIVT